MFPSLCFHLNLVVLFPFVSAPDFQLRYVTQFCYGLSFGLRILYVSPSCDHPRYVSRITPFPFWTFINVRTYDTF